MVDCPTRNNKETIDKRMFVDLCRFVRQESKYSSSVHVVLITQDGDFSYVVNELKDTGATVCLIYRM